jgi:hypothetical protein
VLEELLEALQTEGSHSVEADTDSSDSDLDDKDTEHMMKVLVQAMSGTTSKRSMRLQGLVGKRLALILIDSGSSSNFISKNLADKLQHPVTQMTNSKVSVAGGGTLDCCEELQGVTWYTQGQKFTTDLKILPLNSYDIILGMDWLESQNDGKMWVNWKKKSMRFRHEGNKITLRGVQTTTDTCKLVSAQELNSMIHRGEVCQLMELCTTEDAPHQQPPMVPPSVQEVINSYTALFEDPQSLPPRRKFDHHIPLIPGATPVNVKPYRYAPHQKTEIEKQVKDMLQRGIIHESTSPFTSLVLMVPKKDGSW